MTLTEYLLADAKYNHENYMRGLSKDKSQNQSAAKKKQSEKKKIVLTI